jgi:hypothetical protein
MDHDIDQMTLFVLAFFVGLGLLLFLLDRLESTIGEPVIPLARWLQALWRRRPGSGAGR